jgi:hypothetical protein
MTTDIPVITRNACNIATKPKMVPLGLAGDVPGLFPQLRLLLALGTHAINRLLSVGFQ